MLMKTLVTVAAKNAVKKSSKLALAARLAGRSPREQSASSSGLAVVEAAMQNALDEAMQLELWNLFFDTPLAPGCVRS